MNISTLLYNPIFSIFLAVAIIAFLVYRQIRPRKLSKSSLLLFPLIILYFIFQSLPTFHPTQSKIIEILISSTVSVVLGLLACRQLQVYEGTSGKAMAKGSWMYFLWWLGAFIIKAFLSIIFRETSVHSVSELDILVPVFFLLATRNAYLYWKVFTLNLKLH